MLFRRDIPNWKDKTVGMGSNGACVNIGLNDSMATHMHQEQPHVLVLCCIAHRMELDALAGIKDTEQLQTVKDILHKIYRAYHFSPKAFRELRQIREATEEKY